MNGGRLPELRGQRLPAWRTPESLEAYLAAIARLPVLDAAEEQRLARRMREQHDPSAAQRLALCNLRFVVRVARGYLGYGLPLADLIQEGNVGLLKALRRFDPAHGVRLISFAVHWIRAEIHEFVLRNWRIVRLATTKAQRKLFFRLRGFKRRLGWMSREELERVAQELGVPASEVQAMEARLAEPDLPFDAGPGGREEQRWPEQYLAAPDAALEEIDDAPSRALQEQQVRRALVQLDPRARDIVTRRWLAPRKSGLRELAQEYGVSAERIRQIQNHALARMRESLGAAT